MTVADAVAMRIGITPWLAVLAVACSREPETTVAAPAEFVRFVPDGPDAAELQTATVRYTTADGAVVELIGVVHIADAAYYAALDASFAAADAVLYEMIKPADAAPAGVRDAKSPISMVQTMLCRALELEFQLDALDYSRPNFVHADLTTEAFARLWQERDESLWKMLLRMIAAQSGDSTSITSRALFDAARSKHRAARLKLLLGAEFSKLERTSSGFGEVGPDGRDRSMLLGMRNAAAVDALRARLAAGDRKLALVYGAAHGPDLDLRMTEDLHLQRRAVTWHTAWRVDAREQ